MFASRTASSFLAHHGSRRVERCVLTLNEVKVESPMVDGPLIMAPDFGLDLRYATDLYQRIYCTVIGNVGLLRTIHTNGALYSAAGAGGPPDDTASWSVVASSELGVASAQFVRYVRQQPGWLSALTYVDLWTWVYQPPHQWQGPFTVIHEMWGNHVRWFRVKDSTLVGAKPEPSAAVLLDSMIRILGKHRG